MSSKPVSEFLTEGDCKSYPQLGDIQFNKYLSKCTTKNKKNRFDTKEEAYEAMMNDPEASGIVKSSGLSERSISYNKWTVRKGTQLIIPADAHTPEVACLKL
jgi:hypothetical protein